MRKLKVGMRVKLLPFGDYLTEYGIILNIQKKVGVCGVEVEKIYRKDKYDDGIREVPFDQIVIE